MNKKHIILLCVSSFLVLIVAAYCILYFNSVSITLAKEGFSKRDVVTSFGRVEGSTDIKVVLVSSKKRFAIYEMMKNPIGLWRIDPYLGSANVISTTAKANKFSIGSFSKVEFVHSDPHSTDIRYQTHDLVAGIAKEA